MYLSDLMRAPFIVLQDPAEFDFDFNNIKPTVFNENREVRYKTYKFDLDENLHMIPEDGVYASIININPVNDENGHCLFKVTADVKRTGGDLTNPVIEVDDGSSIHTLDYSEGTGLEFTMSFLNGDTDYTLKFRVKADNFEGSWSEPLSIHTAEQGILPPSISFTDGYNNNFADPKSLKASLSAFETVGLDGVTYSNTDWKILDNNGTEIWSSLGDTTNTDSLDIGVLDVLDYNKNYTLQARYNGSDGTNDYSSEWSSKAFKTAQYVIDDLGISDTVNDNQTISKTVTVNGGQNPTTGTLSVDVSLGSVSIDGFNFDWTIPDLDEDKDNVTISVKIVDGENDISTVYSKTLTVRNVTFETDQTVNLTKELFVEKAKNFVLDRQIVQDSSDTDWGQMIPNIELPEVEIINNNNDNTYDVKGKIYSKKVLARKNDDTFVMDSVQSQVYKDVVPGSETVFNDGYTDFTSTTTLSNGNVLIAYRDHSNNDYGTFVIYDQDGNLVKNETIFNNGVAQYISTTTLSNDNVLIAYRDIGNSNYGTFVIYDQDGNLVKNETVFNSEVTSEISTTTLSNSNVLIAYRDESNSNYGTFIIYDQDGNLVKNKTVFNSEDTRYISTTTLSNNNVLIAYYDGGNNGGYGTFVIYDQNGNLVKDKTVFNSANTQYISTVTLSNGNVLIAYQDVGNSDYGTFVIYDKDGNLVKDETVFNSGATYYISAITLLNGNVLIAYADSNGTFVIYDQDGNLVKNETVFNSGDTYYISTTTLSNGNVLIAYDDNGDNDYGTFTITDICYTVTLSSDDYQKLYQLPNLLLTDNRNGRYKELSLQYADRVNGNKFTYKTVYDLDDSKTYDLYFNGEFFEAVNIEKAEDTSDDVVYGQSGVFNNNGLNELSTTVLNNDNVFVAYSDSSNFGSFAIIDKNGNILKNSTYFNSGTTMYISTTTLQNGNVLIAFRDGSNNDYGTFMIYNQDGELVKDKTIFNSSNTTCIETVTLSNGNVMIIFADNGNSAYGTFMIYNQDGEIVVDKTVFHSENVCSTAATVLTNNNVLIAFQGGDHNYGYYTIVDQDGTIVKSSAAFENSTSVYHISVATLQVGRAVIAYANHSETGKFIILDNNGNTIKSETSFGNNTPGDVSVSSYSNSETSIYFVETISNEAYYVIIDKDGNFIKNETLWSAERSYYIENNILSNDVNLIVYGLYDEEIDNYIITYKIVSVLPNTRYQITVNTTNTLPATIENTLITDYLSINPLDIDTSTVNTDSVTLKLNPITEQGRNLDLIINETENLDTIKFPIQIDLDKLA